MEEPGVAGDLNDGGIDLVVVHRIDRLCPAGEAAGAEPTTA